MQPELIAHRGEMTHYPENTLLALRAAVEAGARYVEFDVQLTRDEVPMVMHDATLGRTTGKPGRILDMPAARLSQMRADYTMPWPHIHKETHIPLLAEAIEYLNTTRGVTAFIEIKRESLEHFGLRKTIDPVLTDLKAANCPWILISFEAEAVEYARDVLECPIGWAFRDYSSENQDRAKVLAPEYLFCKHERLPTPRDALWPGPWRWVIYDIRDVSQALSLRARGAQMIETGNIIKLLGEPPFSQSTTP